MNAEFLIDRLAAGAPAMAALLGGFPAAEASRRAIPGKWSVLEIMCHLRDEEREDFRPRLEITLHGPGTTWPPIDPTGWVIARQYAAADLGRVMAEFVTEREASVRWLRGLDGPAWDLAYDHPSLGRLTAGDLLAAWAAHDLLHLRQLAGAVFASVAARSEPHGTRYAGAW